MSASGSGFYVTITTPKGSTVKRVDGDLLSVGRAEDCNLRIVHAELGRRHLSLMLQAGQCCVEDHGSTNGTYLNGKRIPSHVPTPVVSTDQIQLGQSGIKLNVSVEVDHPPNATATNLEFTSGGTRIVTSTEIQRRQARQEAQAKPIEAKPASQIQEQTERALLEAQKKAAMLVQQGEIEAERKAQDIYRRAEEAQDKAEQAYQRKLNEAFRESEVIYQKANAETGQILDSARQKAAEIRSQAEAFVAERRKRTEEDCERVLAEAQKTARELKENRLLEADDMIRAKEEDLLKETRETMSKRLAAFETDLQKDADRQRLQLSDEIKAKREQLAEEMATKREAAEAERQEQQKHVERLKLDVRQLVEVSQREQKTLEVLEAQLESEREKGASAKAEYEKSAELLDKTKVRVTELRAEINKLEAAQTSMQKQVGEIQGKLVALTDEERVLSNRMNEARESVKTELLSLKEQHEAAKIRLSKKEQDHLEQMKLETTRHTQRLEQEMFDELQSKKERMARELALTVETFLKDNPDGGSMEKLQQELDRQFETQIVSLSKDPGSKDKKLSLIALKRVERWRIRVTGAVVGAALLWVGQTVDMYVRTNTSPLERNVAAAAEQRKLDLELRKFSPVQTPELRDNYVDAVIYTQGFADTYLEDEFQKKFVQALSAYMLKTWRMEEEKSIQIVAATASLVKELKEKRDNIHPDFVQKDIQKMHELETDSVAHLTEILGSEVRFESYKKFEKQFVESYKR